MGNVNTGSVYFDSYVIIALGVVLAAACVAMIVYVIYDRIRSAYAPTRRVQARVVRKIQKEFDVDAPDAVDLIAGDEQSPFARDWLSALLGRSDPANVYQSWDYYITFAFEDRMEEFGVPESIYAGVSEGDVGLLVYKGNRVEFFMRKISPPSTPHSPA